LPSADDVALENSELEEGSPEFERYQAARDALSKEDSIARHYPEAARSATTVGDHTAPARVG